jgi:BolA family transcriptional regulator, general stress-responsive regulator
MRDSPGADRVDRIRALVQDALRPLQLDIVDDSAAHVGHASAGSKGHFRVIVVADQFTGLSRLQRHRLVQGILAPLYETDIHALALTTRAPDE